MPAEPLLIDLHADVVELCAAICDVESVSGNESHLADAVEAALRACAHLEVYRNGDAVVARTQLGRDERIILAGHLDTVPLTSPPNLPTRRAMDEGVDVLWGRGTVDMKGGVAVQLALAAALESPSRDITYVFYDHEEVESSLNGLGRIVREAPDWVAGDFAVLLEPTKADVEGGCKGTLRFEVRTSGVAAHSGRPWLGDNAIHKMGGVIDTLTGYQAQTVLVDGLEFREGLSAVGIAGGAAGNVIPDECVVTVNYRFAPDKDAQAATAAMRALFSGYDLTVTDAADGARPGLDRAVAQAFVESVGGQVSAKQGWTDVARFSSLGVPAVNFGPGDPLLAHKDDERCPIDQIRTAYDALLRWLTN